MKRLSKPLISALALSLVVTACASGGGNTANENGNVGEKSINNATTRGYVTDSGQMARGITGQGVYDRNARVRSDHPGQLPGRGLQPPFPQDSVRPLNQGGNGGNTGTQMRIKQQQPQQAALIPFIQSGGSQYIAAESLVRLLEFKNYQFDAATGEMEIGDTDVAMRIRADSREAEIAGIPFTLAEAPKIINGTLMISKNTVADLFAEEMVFDVSAEGLVVYPSDTYDVGVDTDQPGDDYVDPSLDFADDPTDPFAGDEESEGVFQPQGEAAPALKNINMNSLIRTSKKYLGVKYKFGAKPYPKSKRFDCSSYTRYVFGKYNVDLPRTARAQSRVGKTVSRKNLRKGDLLFFYVPGRFKSNKIAGHVGIYIGGGKMINANTEPKNGVQIRSINRAFWKKTFLKAKRVAY